MISVFNVKVLQKLRVLKVRTFISKHLLRW